MAAPTLMYRQLQGSLKQQMKTKKEKKKIMKNVLANPCKIEWPTITPQIQEEILKKVIDTIKPLDLGKVNSGGKRRQKRNKTIDADGNSEQTSADSRYEQNISSGSLNTQKVNIKSGILSEGKDGSKTAYHTVLTCDKPGLSLEDKTSIRTQLLVGINEVTRGLERDQLRLVLACRSVKPPIIIQHLLHLAASRCCPAACIDRLSQTLCPMLCVSSITAIGFKKYQPEDKPVFNELVDFICQLIPAQALPWLRGESETNEQKLIFSECSTIPERSRTSVKKELIGDSHVETVDRDDGIPNLQGPRDVTKETVNKDYSRFYVYKKDLKSESPDKSTFGADYISLSKDDNDIEDLSKPTVTKLRLKRKSQNLGRSNIKFMKYQDGAYIAIKARENKVKKSKLKKKIKKGNNLC